MTASSALPAPSPVPPNVILRLARIEDCGLLPVVERAAAELFRSTGLIDFSDPNAVTSNTVATFEAGVRAGLLWVAEDRGTQTGNALAGFALCQIVAGDFHLEELSVHPAHGRKGLGRALTLLCCHEAHQRGMLPVYLTTFRSPPWNAPFYARLGFREVADGEAPSWLQEIRQRERSRFGDKRLAMAWHGD